MDAIGGARFDDGQGGDNEVQRTMLEIVNQLDGFDSRGNIKVWLAAACWAFSARDHGCSCSDKRNALCAKLKIVSNLSNMLVPHHATPTAQ